MQQPPRHKPRSQQTGYEILAPSRFECITSVPSFRPPFSFLSGRYSVGEERFQSAPIDLLSGEGGHQSEIFLKKADSCSFLSAVWFAVMGPRRERGCVKGALYCLKTFL
ncbi:hypothetical protein BaRGS_00029829 [Batillaria attramentaria]|uniref:Uncharacterized protein n=1 Tax=Batillaria attramentaria TaxID=370345 RepID=A0ABD0JVG2_9CAEN